MITSVFKKSTPINLISVLILLLFYFLIYQTEAFSGVNSAFSILMNVILFLTLLATIFLTYFISDRNKLAKYSGHTIFFYFLFLLFFPMLFDNINLVLSNFFILLALRRLISLQSFKQSKEKIFDASLWILVASLFHFWSIIYLILVFISIIYHVSRDYRNWVLPFIAFITVVIFSVLFSLLFSKNITDYINSNAIIDLEMDYFNNNYQKTAFIIYIMIALFFLISMIATMSRKSLLLHSAFKKIIISFLIGILVFVLSPNKSNDLLVFTFAPLTIMATSHIEMKQKKISQEIVLYGFIACSLFAFFLQL